MHLAQRPGSGLPKEARPPPPLPQARAWRTLSCRRTLLTSPLATFFLEWSCRAMADYDAFLDLRIEVAEQNVMAVRRLLAAAPDPAALVAGADEAHSSMSAIHLLAYNSAHSLEILRLLLQASPSAAAACTAAGDTPLHRAAGRRSGCAGAVRLLLEAAPSVAAARNDQGDTPLHLASRSRSKTARVVRLLLEAAP